MTAEVQREGRDQLLLQLESGKTPQVRAAAAAALCELAFASPPEGHPEFVPDVVRLLADKQDEVRTAGLALASEVLPAAESKDILIRHLADPVLRVRLEAAGRLADLELPDARGALAAALQDREPKVRFEAARGMAALEHASGLEVLIDALDDADLRYRAAAALARLGHKDAITPLKRVLHGWFVPPFDRTQVAGALAVLGEPDGLAHLLKRIGKKYAIDRPMAVEFLGELDSPVAKQKLLEILANAEDTARGTAARSLGFHGGADVEAALTPLLARTDVSDDFKLDVAEGLLRLGSRAAVEQLTLADAEAQAELVAMRADYGESRS